jgi:hypothetical protein
MGGREKGLIRANFPIPAWLNPSGDFFWLSPTPIGVGKKPEIPKQEFQLSFPTATLAGIHGPDWGMQ